MNTSIRNHEISIRNTEFLESLEQRERSLDIFLKTKKMPGSFMKKFKSVIERIRGKSECQICKKRYKNVKCHEQMKHEFKRSEKNS